MRRLGQVLNALIIFLGGRLIWQGWRQASAGGDAGAAAPPAATGGLLLPTDEIASVPAAAAAAPPGAGQGESASTPTGAAASAVGELSERQSVAAEARFSPAFPVEIGEEDGSQTGGTEAPEPLSGATVSGAPQTGDSGPTPSPTMWAGVEAADAPTARDLDLATPLPPAAGPVTPVGAIPGDGTATCPDDHPIKGNASSMIYHQPGQPSYERTVAEFCFTSAEVAEAAGYRAPRR